MGLSLAARALPPLRPPRRPRLTAAASLPDTFVRSSISPVAILATMTAAPITSAGRFSPLGPLGTLITLALGQFFDWRFVAFRTILAGGNPKFPALVALDPDAVLVYPTILYFANSVCHGAQIRRPQVAAPALVNGVKIQTETLPGNPILSLSLF